jgi:hypothetical protein
MPRIGAQPPHDHELSGIIHEPRNVRYAHALAPTKCFFESPNVSAYRPEIWNNGACR